MSIKRTITLGFSILLIAIVALWMMRHSIANALIDDALLKATQMAKRYKVELVDMESGPLLIPTPFDISTQKFKTKFDIGLITVTRLGRNLMLVALRSWWFK